MPKYIISPGFNTATAVPTMERPICIKGISPNLCDSIRQRNYGKRCECQVYKEHLSSLPLSDQLKDELLKKYSLEELMKGGQEVEAVVGRGRRTREQDRKWPTKSEEDEYFEKVLYPSQAEQQKPEGEKGTSFEELEKTATEFIFKKVSRKRVNATSSNDREAAAFVEGFKFKEWLERVSMSHPNIPLHIKYRMYVNQENGKQ